MAKDQSANKKYKDGYRVLIVARRGEFASGLAVLLSSVPRLGPMQITENQAEVQEAVRTNPPTFVILDEEHLGNSLPDIIKSLSTNSIRPRIIVMGSDERNNPDQAGIDIYILKGTRSNELLSSIQNLIPQPDGN